jgi:hypothetical protein
VTLLEFPDFFLLARGVNMGLDAETKEQYYAPQRADCLWELKQTEYKALLAELAATFKADENEAAVEALLADWKWGKK